MLGLWFEIGVGSVIENTQIVFICESLNDFTPGINIMTAPQIIVSIVSLLPYKLEAVHGCMELLPSSGWTHVFTLGSNLF